MWIQGGFFSNVVFSDKLSFINKVPIWRFKLNPKHFSEKLLQRNPLLRTVFLLIIKLEV